MVKTVTQLNAKSLEAEINWFDKVLDTRLRLHLGHEAKYKTIDEIEPPNIKEGNSPYTDFIIHYNLNFYERFILILSLIPHISPESLDPLLFKNPELDCGFTEFGGLKGSAHSGFLPTGETAMFLLAGKNLSNRFVLQNILDGSHPFALHGILKIEVAHKNEPHLAGLLTLSRHYIDIFTIGRTSVPSFGSDFPAQRLDVKENWNDLVLAPYVMEQIAEIKSWIKNSSKLMDEWGFGRRMKPGYRSLFYGPPGTGKSMTAALLGQETGLDVYRIDLSMVVSKYVGETEKNLSRIFDCANRQNWILFFDEADALFGKRTATKDAHDRYANQEVAYLLQKIEEYDGVAILATNLKDNMDDAFIRRFHSIIHFPMPCAVERLGLWKKAFTDKVSIEEETLFDDIANDYEISGGAIMNVAHYAALMSVGRGKTVILRSDIEVGIRKELQKEGRSI